MFDTLSLDHRLIPVRGIATYLYATKDEAVTFGKFAHACVSGLKISIRSIDGGFRLTINNRW